MLKETILTVQTCDLKVDIHCYGCAKEIKKMMHKIDGVYQTNVDREQGKVTVTGVMDIDAVFKKLKKAGMSAQLWDANSTVVSKHQKLQLGGSDRGDQLKFDVGNGLFQGEGSIIVGGGARSNGGTNGATIVLPQLTPTVQQHVPNMQEQIEQRLQMLKGEKLPRNGLPQGEGSSIAGGGARSNGGTNDATIVLPQPTLTVQQHVPNMQEQIEQRLQKLKGKKLPLNGLPQGEGISIVGGGARSNGGMNDATIVLPQPTLTVQQHVPNMQEQIEQRLQRLKGKKLPLNGLPQGEGSSIVGGGARSNGGMNDATIVLPQPTPTVQQHVPNMQEQIEQRLQMLKGEKLPPHLMGMPPAINRGKQQTGEKIYGGTKVLVPENANNDNKNAMGMKLYQDAGGSQVKNGAIGQQPHNGALGSLNNQSMQGKKDIGVGVGNLMIGGSMAPQNGGMMMRSTNNMTGPTSLPTMGKIGGMSMDPYTHLDGYNKQSYGGGALQGLGAPASSLPWGGFYPSGADNSGTEMMQQVARNPMPQQPYMMVEPQQEHGMMMMNAHYPHSHNAHYGSGGTGYQLMGDNNGHGHLQQQYPPPMYYPTSLPPQHDNNFSDDEEKPNICSLM